MYPVRVLLRSALVAAFLCVPVAPALAQTIGLNFTGITKADGALLNNNNGYAPPDNAGAVGQNQIVQLINGAFAVYDKSTGNQLEAISGRQFWLDAGVDPGTAISNLGAFNQRILYDPATNRWVAAALTGESTNNRVLLARSETSDPMGGWKAVSFLGNNGGDGKFVDYTGLGMDANGVYITTNNYFDNASGLASTSVFSVPKSDLLAGTPTLANMTRFDGVNGGSVFLGATLQPITNYGPVGNHAPILATTILNSDTYLYRTDLSNTASAGATLSSDATPIEVNEYALPPSAAQPDGTRVIGLQDHRFKSNVVQVGDTIFAAHDVMVDGHAGITWYKINETTNQVIQSGTLSDPNYDYYQASIAANANGDVMLGFNRSGLGSDGQISIFGAWGTTLGDTTTFGNPFSILNGTVNDYHYINNRWGDYTTTLVDPFNPNVFWTFQEYALAGNAWATRITQITVPEPATWVLGVCGVVTLVIVAYRANSNIRVTEARRVSEGIFLWGLSRVPCSHGERLARNSCETFSPGEHATSHGGPTCSPGRKRNRVEFRRTGGRVSHGTRTSALW
jgi:hypothetical protein